MKFIHKLLNITIVLTVLAVGVSFFMKTQLPKSENLLPETYQNPIQENRIHQGFIFDYRGTGYQVSPIADYELWGLVVAHNDIGKFGDIYHSEDSVDLKDICVVWGENAKSGVYEKGKYKSGSWTCYWRFKSGEAWRKFSESQIANSHLIASDPDVQKQIRQIRVGDQIHLTGYLVNYENMDTNWKRETSMTRKDTGNNSCEVIFVENLKILKSGNALWYSIYYWGKLALLILIAFKITLIFREGLLNTKGLKEVDTLEDSVV